MKLPKLYIDHGIWFVKFKQVGKIVVENYTTKEHLQCNSCYILPENNELYIVDYSGNVKLGKVLPYNDNSNIKWLTSDNISGIEIGTRKIHHVNNRIIRQTFNKINPKKLYTMTLYNGEICFIT
jgi:hypothetical protein